MPETPDDVEAWLSDLNSGKQSGWHRTHEWPREMVSAGDWSPAQYYDGELAHIVRRVCDNQRLTPANKIAMVEPNPPSIRQTLVNPTKIVARPPPPISTYSVMWTHKTDVRRTMFAEPEFQAGPKPGKSRTVEETLWPKASKLVVAARLRTTNVRTPAIFVSEPVVGNAWAPVTPSAGYEHPDALMRAWCVYMNSTCGTLAFLNIRSRTLTYPQFGIDHLRSIPLPDPTRADLTPLVRVFDDLCNSELQPWAKMDIDPVRHKIDDAVAEVLDLDPAEIADWRRRIVNEPTVSNKPAA